MGEIMAERAMTIRDVAKKAGVAVSTASRALGNGPASLETRQKVREVAQELNFVPNQAARQLTSGRSNIIAIAVPERTQFLFNDAFVSGMISHLADSFTQKTFLPFLALTGPHDTESLNKLLHDSGADGAVVLSFHYSKGLVDTLAQFDKPTIFIGQPPHHMNYPYVDVDSFHGGYEAAELLVQRGRRRIAIIAGPDDMLSPQQRTSGCVEGLAAAGLEPIAINVGDFTSAHGCQAMKEILADDPQVDAVFAHSDQIAAGAMQALSQYGKRVPQDLSIVGFDDFHVARALSPGLTTFAQPLADLAETATEMLAWRLRHGEWKTTAQVLPVTLILRGSL